MRGILTSGKDSRGRDTYEVTPATAMRTTTT
jgi:hypothetical protein